MNQPNPKQNRPLPQKREEQRTRMGSSITATNQPVKGKPEATRVSSAVRPVNSRPAQQPARAQAAQRPVRKKEE